MINHYQNITNVTDVIICSVLIAIAMEAEAAPLIRNLLLELQDDFFPTNTPYLAYQGKYKSCNITVITNGKDKVHGTGVDNIGTVPAAIGTFLALDKLNLIYDQKVDILINAGTCDGFKRMGAEIGDVYLSTAVAFHDRHIPLPGFELYGIGRIHSTTVQGLPAEIGAKLGVLSTGDSFDTNALDNRQMRENGASLKDMEAAAIAWCSELYGTPHFALKVVTDIVDGDERSEEVFLDNLHNAAKSMQEALEKSIAYLCAD